MDSAYNAGLGHFAGKLVKSGIDFVKRGYDFYKTHKNIIDPILEQIKKAIGYSGAMTVKTPEDTEND